MTNEIQGLMAIDIRAVDEQAFATIPAGRAVMIDKLPTAYVHFPPDTSKMAVLSWRWDIDLEPSLNISRNVFLAIQEARRMGIDYLFMDMVSINQQLQGNALIAEVINFSSLYHTLPVIAAYDKPTEKEWLLTMRRPWLFHEARLYRKNPASVNYVGYLPKQGCSDWGFLHMVERVWESGLSKSILYVLIGKVGMGELSDLRFLIPQHADVLEAACQQMSRNDYLLTAALLIQQSEWDTRLNGDQNSEPVKFDHYQLVLEGAPGFTYTKNILFDGKKVGAWKHSMSNTGNSRYRLEPTADTEATIRQYLGIAPPEDKNSQVVSDRQNLKDIAKPQLNVVSAGE